MSSTGKPTLTTDTYPDDLDTTSIALMELNIDEEVTNSVMDKMLEYLTEDGILQVRNSLIQTPSGDPMYTH